MLATRGFEELLHQEPLLRLVDDGQEMAAALEQLRLAGFQDGAEEMRWQASQQGTWERRASEMITALGEKSSTGPRSRGKSDWSATVPVADSLNASEDARELIGTGQFDVARASCA